jgi:16S rRNA (guanine966-N2)-methyltransferase
VLLDPPLIIPAGQVAIDKLRRLGWIGEGTWVALETAATDPRVRGFVVDAERSGQGKDYDLPC